MLRKWWNQWLNQPSQVLRRRRRTGSTTVRRRGLLLEVLEDRTLPSFAAPVALDLGGAPSAAAIGHVEGAARPLDVVTANTNGSVSVLLGKGDGTLQNPITLPVGGSPDAVALADLLGNGLDDIVAANANGTVTVLLSNGNGTFAAPETFAVGATPKGVAIGDFLGSGHLSIVTANTDGSVSVLPGTGSGGFGSPILTPIGNSLTSVAVGDFNHDARLDLVVGTSTGLDILLGKGDGTFALKQTVPFFIKEGGLAIPTAVNAVAVSALRGAGSQDIVALSDDAVSVLLGKGDGTFGSAAVQPGSQFGVGSFVVGDFTGDGKPDIATSNFAPPFSGGPSVNLLVGKGDGTFAIGPAENLGETANALAAGDFTGTGKLDLVLASKLGSNTVTLLPGTGSGSFTVAPTVPVHVGPIAIASADFNGDGKPDLVTAGVGGNVDLLLNNGDGTFHAGASLTVSGAATAMVVGDFNGDGKQDIAVAAGVGVIDVFLGNGKGTFAAPKVFNLGNVSIRSLVAGDFNRDGRLDLAVNVMLPDGLETSEVIVLLGNGNGTFHKGQTIKVGMDAEGLAAADFNGDGKLDLVTTTFLPDGSRDVRVLLGNGNGTFQAPLITHPGDIGRDLATGDFNGDGKLDLVLLDNTDNRVVVLPGTGKGTFGQPLTFTFDNPTKQVSGVAVGDFFGEGKLSVAVSTGLGNVSVLRGNGDGTFQAPINFLGDLHGQQPVALVAADFNGDGKPDLAVTNFLTGDVSVLLNTTPKPGQAAPVATTTALTTDASPAVFGQVVTLTATVNAASGTAQGTITFFDGATSLGEVSLDPNVQARLLVQLSVGSHSLRAVFAGLSPFTASTSATVSETVNQAATTTTLAVNPNGFGIKGIVLLTATVIPVAPGAGLPTGTVTFTEGGQVLGTAQVDSTGQASLILDGTLAQGQHTVTATYGGDGNFKVSTSAPVTFTVSGQGGPPLSPTHLAPLMGSSPMESVPTTASRNPLLAVNMAAAIASPPSLDLSNNPAPGKGTWALTTSAITPTGPAGGADPFHGGSSGPEQIVAEEDSSVNADLPPSTWEVVISTIASAPEKAGPARR
jgi:hypothetical protein